MTLKDCLKELREPIAILTLTEEGIESMEFDKKDFNKIPRELLSKEVVDEQQEEDCLELWVM